VPDPMVRQDIVEKLSALYDKVQDEKQKKHEHEEALRLERERIAKEQREATEYALDHCEEGDVILDYTGEQKYILVVDPETKKLVFVSEDLPFHSNIKSKYYPNGLCL
jgi:translation initiation factor 2B subunit (eIF-2B alpha/beta/delta family)